ncbi:MAG TPA: demethoxyubiquinone hydroxylase family protein [Gammaproteobacteria bacterium]|nr:demethoxyubiquinone hydroxylase family protein [Gammaproteobacteria bacterium]
MDRLLVEVDACLRTLTGVHGEAPRPNPADASVVPEGVTGCPPAPDQTGGATSPDPALESEPVRRHVAGLMRVNHAGEVAAQALYRGQALTARSSDLGARLDAARQEEIDHLVWCARRLEELGSHPSRFGLLWYGGAFALGALAGLAGDRVSLGFLAETERQVSEHLDGHLTRLPEGDTRSRRILVQMRVEEDAHRAFAEAHGGVPLPGPVRGAMRAAAGVMKWLAYRV